MTRALAGIVVISVLTAFALVFVGMHAASPLLYNPSFDGSTPSHTNPAGLDKTGNNEAERLLPLMSDLLDSPGTVMVNIRYGDLDLAQRDFEEFSEMARSLDTLVVNLEMSESEIEEFRRMNRKNLEIMNELLNSTSRLDELRTLEVRFRDSNDPQAMTSITYEGEALRKKVRGLLTDYESQREPMTRTGEDLELDTTEYQESHQIFEEIVRSIEEEQDTRSRDLPVPVDDPYRITLRTSPPVVFYHDTLVISGFLSGPQTTGVEIAIFIDSRQEASVFTDSSGMFFHRVYIDSMSAGGHTVFVTFRDSTFSDIHSFTVETLPTTLTLASPSPGKGGYSAYGVLSAPDRPVTGAGVSILVDGKVTRKVVTGNDGSYQAVIPLAAGEHDIKAVFTPLGLPLGPSESGSRHIVVRPEDAPVTIPGLYSILFGAIVIAASSGGAYYYLRRRPGIPYRSLPGEFPPGEITVSPLPGTPGAAPETSAVPFAIRADETLEYYRREENSREAARLLFLFLRTEITARLGLRHERSITAREMVKSSEGRAFFSPLRIFTQIYEKVRYDRAIAGQDEKDRIGAAFSATAGVLEGDEH
ncbi:hypothetical protein J2741_000618 [Methanolinea mesophila]|uniref:hypothetical protein n=1 Tax=Methanolinea mesophila TaxID=547055 RepID=UPI001AE45DC2|nr:hypothetical protein [Methanolinea mesophila]MBP1928071.1 hypothetical protein [Methanolinea mesophila]